MRDHVDCDCACLISLLMLFFSLLETSGKIQHLIVKGDPKFQSARIEKHL